MRKRGNPWWQQRPSAAVRLTTPHDRAPPRDRACRSSLQGSEIIQSAARSIPTVKPSYSNLIRKAKQSLCETFDGFDKFMRLRINIGVFLVARRQWDAHLKRTVIDPLPNAAPYRLWSYLRGLVSLRHSTSA